MARYIIEFMFCSGLFVALYKLLIKGRVAHHQARMYLVWAMFLSVIIPMLELPLYPAHTVYFELPIINSDVQNLPSSTVVSDAAPAVQSAAQTDWRRILSIVAWGIYILVFALNIARFVYRLWVIRRLRLCAQLTVYEAYTLAVNERISEPFSFWRTIYMNRHFVGREREQIIVHELSHILHHHTAERLSVELLRCVFWFNPFVWVMYVLANRDIELSCDEKVIHIWGRENRAQYALALLFENDPVKAEVTRNEFEKAAKTYPYPHEIDSERDLIRIAETVNQRRNELRSI